LEIVRSPYRRFLGPLRKFLAKLEAEHPGRTLAVVIPEVVEPKWYLFLLHTQRAAMLKMSLLLRGSSQVVVISVPWRIE